MQSAHDNDEALEPHAGVHAHADEINNENILPTPAEPEQLRREHIAKQHAHRSEEHTSELQSPDHLVCRLLLEKKKTTRPRSRSCSLSRTTDGAPLVSVCS